MCRERKGMSQRTGRSNRDHAMQRTHSSAGWFFHLGGLSWSEVATINWSLCWVLYFAVTVIWYNKGIRNMRKPTLCYTSRTWVQMFHTELISSTTSTPHLFATYFTYAAWRSHVLANGFGNCFRVCVSLHPLGGAEHKTSFPNPCW